MVDTCFLRRHAREFEPGQRANVREVPDTALSVDKKVERGVDEVGDVARRDDGVVGNADFASLTERAEGGGQKIVRVPRAEKSARPYEKGGRRSQEMLLEACLARTVNAERIRSVTLDVGLPFVPVEHKVTRESNQRDAESGAFIAQHAASLGVYAKTIHCVVLGVRSEEHTSELQSQFHLVCRL